MQRLLFLSVLWSGLPKYICKGCANWVTIGKKIFEVLKMLLISMVKILGAYKAQKIKAAVCTNFIHTAVKSPPFKAVKLFASCKNLYTGRSIWFFDAKPLHFIEQALTDNAKLP